MAMSARQTRVQLLVTALLLLLLTALLAWLSNRYGFIADWTRAGRNSLSAASIAVLDQMPGPVSVTSYAREEAELRNLVRDFVGRYQRYKPDISLEFVNPDLVPDEARNLGISVNGELLLGYGGRLEHVHNDSEQEFSNALQRLLRVNENWVVFIEGHEERSPLATGSQELSGWGGHLQDRGLKVQPLNLASVPDIPANTTLLVIASPRSAYLPGEQQRILEYLAGGGNLLWLLDPGYSDGLDQVREVLGLQVQDGTIIDIAGQVIGIDDPTITLATRQLYGEHAAVAGLDQTTLFPRAVALTSVPTPDWRVSSVITTSTHTWLERGPLQGDIGFDEQADILGPFILAMAMERGRPGGGSQRVMVVGDSDFVSNNYIDNNGILELGQRLVEWLVNDDAFINIPPRTAEDAQLQFSSTTAVIIGFGFLVFLPVGLSAAGLFVWWRRRRL